MDDRPEIKTVRRSGTLPGLGRWEAEILQVGNGRCAFGTIYPWDASGKQLPKLKPSENSYDTVDEAEQAAIKIVRELLT
jgi:hypothetical protein